MVLVDLMLGLWLEAVVHTVELMLELWQEEEDEVVVAGWVADDVDFQPSSARGPCLPGTPGVSWLEYYLRTSVRSPFASFVATAGLELRGGGDSRSGEGRLGGHSSGVWEQCGDTRTDKDKQRVGDVYSEAERISPVRGTRYSLRGYF